MVKDPPRIGGRKLRMSARVEDPGYESHVLPVDANEMREYRCPSCDRLMFKARLVPGSMVETMCHNKWCRDKKRKAVFSVA